MYIWLIYMKKAWVSADNVPLEPSGPQTHVEAHTDTRTHSLTRTLLINLFSFLCSFSSPLISECESEVCNWKSRVVGIHHAHLVKLKQN